MENELKRTLLGGPLFITKEREIKSIFTIWAISSILTSILGFAIGISELFTQLMGYLALISFVMLIAFSILGLLGI